MSRFLFFTGEPGKDDFLFGKLYTSRIALLELIALREREVIELARVRYFATRNTNIAIRIRGPCATFRVRCVLNFWYASVGATFPVRAPRKV